VKHYCISCIGVGVLLYLNAFVLLFDRNKIYSEVELTYDRFSRLSVWRWGDLKEMYGYDRAGRLAEIRYADGKSTLYVFKDMFSSLVSLNVSFVRIDFLMTVLPRKALEGNHAEG